MKKLIPLIFALVLLFALAACGGGGGGGGGGMINYSDTLVSYADSGFLVNNTPMFYVKRSATGIEVYMIGVTPNSATLLEGSFQQDGTFKASEQTIDGWEHTLYLGGQGTQLEYSEFGFWLMVRGGSKSTLPFKIGDSKAAAIPQASQAFTGNAVAQYVGYTNQTVNVLHTGTATMQHNGAAGWTLDMIFPNAFDINITNITMGPSGGFANDTNTKVTVDTAKYKVYGNFEVGTATIDGQFYGPAKTSASEAVGDFRLQSTNADIIRGAFGLK